MKSALIFGYFESSASVFAVVLHVGCEKKKIIKNDFVLDNRKNGVTHY